MKVESFGRISIVILYTAMAVSVAGFLLPLTFNRNRRIGHLDFASDIFIFEAIYWIFYYSMFLCFISFLPLIPALYNGEKNVGKIADAIIVCGIAVYIISLLSRIAI